MNNAARGVVFRKLIGMAVVFLVLGVWAGMGHALEIERVEINQVLGMQKNQHLNFVAGKGTVVRAFLSEEVLVDSAASSAEVYRDDAQVTVLSPKSSDKPVRVVDFLCPSNEACGNWAAGSYRFSVTVNGISKTEPSEEASHEIRFLERKKIRILALPVRANYDGVVTQVPDDKWKTMWRFTAAVYPISPDNILWSIREEFDASEDYYDLETEEGQQQLWEALTNLMPTSCSADPDGEGCYDLIVGFISDRPNTFPEGELQGYTFGKPTNIVVAKDEDAPATVAHEIAHIYGIGDTYDGGSFRCEVNPAPDDFTGTNWDNPEASISCQEGREAFPDSSATLIPASANPYEVGGRGALGDTACYMGSGASMAKIWTSPEVYDHLFYQLAPENTVTRKRRSAPHRLLYYFGYVNDAGEIDTEPWESFMDTVEVPDTTGTYMIRAVDAEGKILATQKLSINFYVLGTPPAPNRKLDWAPFEGAIRFPEDTARLEIVKDDKILDEIIVSANAPVISGVSPGESGSIDGPYTIQWTATDADDDPLTFTVEYNPDVTDPKSEWMILNGDLGQPVLQDDFSELPGGPHAKIRVIATDGILASSAESSEFTVPIKPPFVFIEDPEWGYSYETDDEIDLEVDAFDPQDDWLENDSLVWTSDISGVIGTGNALVVKDLPMGEHTITLTATNRAGLTARDSITLEVGNLSVDYLEYRPGDARDLVMTNTYANRTTTVKYPKEAVSKDIYVEFEVLKKPDTLPEGFDYTGRYFFLFAEEGQGEEENTWSEITTPASPVRVIVDYAGDLPSDIDPDGLRLYRLNQSGQWVDVATECTDSGTTYDRSVTGKLGINICRLGEFALTGRKKTVTPVDPAPVDPTPVDPTPIDPTPPAFQAEDNCFVNASSGSSLLPLTGILMVLFVGMFFHGRRQRK